MTVNHLNSGELRQVYRALSAGNFDGDPSDVPLPDRDNGWYQRSIQRQLNAYNPQQLVDADAGIDGAVVPESTQDRFISLARRAVGGQVPTDTTEILYLHTLLALNGHNNDVGFEFDNELNNTELGALGTILAGYDAGNTTLDNLGAAQNAQAAAEAARAAEAAAEFNASQASLTEQFGLSAVGFEGTRAEMIQEFTYVHQGSLQRFSEDIFGEQMNLHQIREAMLTDPSVSAQALAHVIQSTDYTEEIVQSLETGNAAQVQEAQAVLRLSEMEAGEDGFTLADESIAVTGNTNLETVEAAQEYIVGERSALGNAHIAYTGDVAHSVIRHDILEGNIPVEWDGLPAELRADLEGLDERTIANQVASHLSDPANFNAYNEYLLSTSPDADLFARLGEIEVVAAPDAPDVEERLEIANNPLAADAGTLAAADAIGVTDRGTAIFSETEVAYQAIAEQLLVVAGEDGMVEWDVAFREAMYAGFDINSNGLVDTTNFAGDVNGMQRMAERFVHDGQIPEVINVSDPAQLTQVIGLATVVRNFDAYRPTVLENGRDAIAAFRTGTGAPDGTGSLHDAATTAVNRALGIEPVEPEVSPAHPDQDQGTPIAAVESFTAAAEHRVAAGGTGHSLSQQGAVFAPS